jgi:cytochrome c5
MKKVILLAFAFALVAVTTVNAQEPQKKEVKKECCSKDSKKDASKDCCDKDGKKVANHECTSKDGKKHECTSNKDGKKHECCKDKAKAEVKK